MGDTTSTSLTDTKAKNGTTYSYTVRCLNSSAKAYTSGYNATGKTIARLTRPTISSVTNSASKAMTVKWNKNTSATGYQICYKVGSTKKTVTVTGSGTVSKAITGLTKGKTYAVYVRSYKTVNNVKYYSAWSASKSVKISK